MTGNKKVLACLASRVARPLPSRAWIPPSYGAEGGHSTHANTFIALTHLEKKYYKL